MARTSTTIVTDPTARIETLDVLRGLALFGMIVVHFHQRFRVDGPTPNAWPGEWLIGWVVWWGLEDKAAAIFAFLFGVGFAILLRRASAAGRPLAMPYLRRLLALAVAGVLVEALTSFAILIQLALWGLPLLVVRNWSTRTLLVLVGVAALAEPLFHLGRAVNEVLDPVTAAATQEGARAAAAQAQTYAAEVMQRLGRMQRRYVTWRALIPGVTFTLFLVGLLAVRHGVLDAPRRHVRLILSAMVFGLASWLVFWLVLPRMPEAWYGWNDNAWPIRYGLGIVANQWLAFTYMGAVILLLAYRPAWTRRLDAFGVAGRMAFTNYVLQAAVVYYLSSRFGLGLRLRPYLYVGGAVVLFTLLALFSRLWLARFAYGPLEWGWRALTYLQLPQARRTALAAAAPAAP
ncbi:MAG TPA: DUF418 domain-containing protein [Gemmatimonadaceae bacterium]